VWRRNAGCGKETSDMILRQAVISFTLVIAIAAAACGRGGSPTQPTNAPGSSFIVSGVVREKLPSGAPGLPIKGVRIQLGQTASITTTDNDGRYSLVAGGGSFDVNISKDGYRVTTLRVEALSGNRTLDAALDPILRTLTGIVTEASQGTPVVGASVEILSGSNRGRSTTTDTTGGYTFFANVWGDFDLSVSVGGYEPTTVRAAVEETVTRVDVRLNPDGQMTRVVFTGALCTVAPPVIYIPFPCQENSSFPYPVQAHHSFSVQRPATMTLAVSYEYAGDYYWNYLNLELRCASQLIAEKRIDLLWNGPPITQPDNMKGPVQIPLPQACNYEIKLFNYISDRKGGHSTNYRMEVSYPR
jgi:hypothetical protein